MEGDSYTHPIHSLTLTLRAQVRELSQSSSHCGWTLPCSWISQWQVYSVCGYALPGIPLCFLMCSIFPYSSLPVLPGSQVAGFYPFFPYLVNTVHWPQPSQQLCLGQEAQKRSPHSNYFVSFVNHPKQWVLMTFWLNTSFLLFLFHPLD